MVADKQQKRTSVERNGRCTEPLNSNEREDAGTEKVMRRSFREFQMGHHNNAHRMSFLDLILRPDAQAGEVDCHWYMGMTIEYLHFVSRMLTLSLGLVSCCSATKLCTRYRTAQTLGGHGNGELDAVSVLAAGAYHMYSREFS